MIEVHQGLSALEIGKKLEAAMESFLTDADVIRFGSVYSQQLPAQHGLPPRNVVTVIIHNPEIHRLLTDRLLKLSQKAGVPANSIEELVALLGRKGFILIAQSAEAQSYQRVRKILPIPAN